MKLEQKFRLGQLYDRPETIIIIASFPGRKDRSIKAIDAVASYTDHFSRSFKKEMANHGRQIVVFAQKIDGEEWYKEGDMLVCRVWDKGSPLCFGQILAALTFFPHVTSLLVQFEFHQFGGKLMTGLFPLFLGTLRARGKVITLVLHQVVDNIATLSGHLHIPTSGMQTDVLNIVLIQFYRACATIANTIIVHSTIFAERLEKLTGRKDAIVIPHGLGAIHQKYSKRQARKILGYKKRDYIVMSFGFLTWYKGTDWLAETFAATKRKNIQLIIAGGVSPNIQIAPYYKEFTDRIKQSIESHKNISLTGFVEDTDIPLYFAAADVIVLPYRSLMSSSGPLAMTMAFKKPFLISKTLSPYARDADFDKALRESGLKIPDISFSLHEKDFWNKLQAVKRNPKRYKKLSTFVRTERLWSSIAMRFYEVLKNVGLEPTGKFGILEGSTATYVRT